MFNSITLDKVKGKNKKKHNFEEEHCYHKQANEHTNQC